MGQVLVSTQGKSHLGEVFGMTICSILSNSEYTRHKANEHLWAMAILSKLDNFHPFNLSEYRRHKASEGWQ